MTSKRVDFKNAHPNPPADPNKPTKFKVGDKVRYLASDWPRVFLTVKVIAITKNGYRVELRDGQTRMAAERDLRDTVARDSED